MRHVFEAMYRTSNGEIKCRQMYCPERIEESQVYEAWESCIQSQFRGMLDIFRRALDEEFFGLQYIGYLEEGT